MTYQTREVPTDATWGHDADLAGRRAFWEAANDGKDEAACFEAYRAAWDAVAEART